MTLIDQVFRSPQLSQILREPNQLWDKEQAARKEFYETITDFHSPVKYKYRSEGVVASKMIKGFKRPIRAAFYERDNLKALQQLLK